MPLGGKEMQRALEADKRKGALSEVNKQYFLKSEKAFEQIVFTTSHKCEKIENESRTIPDLRSTSVVADLTSTGCYATFRFVGLATVM